MKTKNTMEMFMITLLVKLIDAILLVTFLHPFNLSLVNQLTEADWPLFVLLLWILLMIFKLLLSNTMVEKPKQFLLKVVLFVFLQVVSPKTLMLKLLGMVAIVFLRLSMILSSLVVYLLVWPTLQLIALFVLFQVLVLISEFTIQDLGIWMIW